MNRPTPAHTRHTVPLADLRSGDVLIFPHAWTRGAHSWEVWRLADPRPETESHPKALEASHMTEPTTMRADAVRVGDEIPNTSSGYGLERVAEVSHGYRTPANLPAVCLLLEQSGRVIYPAAESLTVRPGVALSRLEWNTLAEAALAGADRADDEAERLDREVSGDAADPDAVLEEAEGLRRLAVEIRAAVRTAAERGDR